MNYIGFYISFYPKLLGGLFFLPRKFLDDFYPLSRYISSMIRLFLILTTLLMVRLADSQSLPEGFFLETVTDQIPYPVGMVHTGREVSYVWSQDGKLWEMTGHQISSGPVIDISDEVGFWSDHGMLGVALHPDFLNNGWIYLMYVVDRYHLYHGSDSQYDAGVDEYNQATIARITRYTI